jgi:UDP-glucose 4-epimerase
MSRYLVTGAGGFIGSYIARRLIERGDEVVIFDNLTTGQAGNLPPEAQMVDGDISQQDAIERIPGGHYDAVLHLAGQSSGEISHDDPSLDISSNALGTLLLLQWSHRNDVSHFLYASSMAPHRALIPRSSGCLTCTARPKI